MSEIQGDGRKFLDHFKSYFGSQISVFIITLINYLLFWILAVIGRYGPDLIIMIFVTKNNF